MMYEMKINGISFGITDFKEPKIKMDKISTKGFDCKKLTLCVSVLAQVASENKVSNINNRKYQHNTIPKLKLRKDRFIKC